MKTTTLHNVLSVLDFILIAAVPLSVYAGSLLLFVIGCAGFGLMMNSLSLLRINL